MTASGNLLPFDARERLRRTEPRAPQRREGAGIGLQLAGIARHFGENSVLSDVDLDVAPGEFVAIVGHSGCGKSTLLRLIAGLDKPSGGALLADGRPVAGQLPDARILFQDARLLPWRRVLQNVGIGARGDWKPAALEVLRRVGLDGRSEEWPAVLSGGQRQRVALARALLARPKLLLLDEPLGALDALTRLDMQQLVEEVWLEQGFTAILVTHDVGEAVALADRVVVLGEGKILMIEAVERERPRLRGDAALAEIEGRILDRLMRRR